MALHCRFVIPEARSAANDFQLWRPESNGIDVDLLVKQRPQGDAHLDLYGLEESVRGHEAFGLVDHEIGATDGKRKCLQLHITERDRTMEPLLQLVLDERPEPARIEK